MTTRDKLIDFRERRMKVELGGGEEGIARLRAGGRLTARERMALLFDGGDFEELYLFVSHRCTDLGMAGKEVPGEGVVTGHGLVNGRPVFAFAQDFSVMGGSLGEMHALKIVKCLDKAIAVGCPVVGLNDSGGARIQEGVDALAGYGQIFSRNTLASGVIPQVTAVMGPSAGGAVYSPALMDFIYMVKRDYARMFITGPQVIEATTGEKIGAVELGGAMTHNETSGVAHFVAESDADCIEQIKKLLSYLPSNCRERPPVLSSSDPPDRREEELDGIIPDRSNRPYDMKRVISLLVDNGEYYESQAYYAKNIITCFARLDGKTLGIIANQPRHMAGCLDIDASDKASRFIRFCDCFNIPLLTLVDVPGYLPGTKQEFGGIIRHGAKLLFAYPEATVPKVTVVTRKAYGGAYLGMCSGQTGADQVFAWPTAEIAVMGPSGAANIIFRGLEGEELAAKTEEYERNFANPYQAARRGYIERVIEPNETRPALVRAFRMLEGKTHDQGRPWKKHGNMPV